MDAAAYTERTGCPLHTSYLPAKLSWLAENEPDAFRACARFVSPGEYLIARLFSLERVTCSVSMASATGLLDQRRGIWDRETLAHLPGGITEERLSPIGDAPVAGFAAHAAGAAVAAGLDALAGIPWYPAFGDGACSNLGCGATGPERLALMIGTSGALRVVSPFPSGGSGASIPAAPPGLWRYQADARRFLVGGALSNGGNVWAWLTETLKLPAALAEGDEAVIAALPPDGHGLTILPFLHGERAPGWRDDARAMITGLSAATTPAQIVLAHLEAVAYRFAAIRDRLKALAPRAEIVGTGAALQASPVWTQILADVLGEPITLSSQDQASSRGAALLVRERLGNGAVEAASDALPDEHAGARFEPNPSHQARYAEGRARHEALYARFVSGSMP
jgi:gluconokinase